MRDHVRDLTTAVGRLACLLSILLGGGLPATAQFRAAPEIEESSERVLDGPEFRHLRRRVRDFDGETGSAGRSRRRDAGNAGGNAGEGRRANDRDRPDEVDRNRARRERADQVRRSSSSDSSNVSSSSGGSGNVVGSLFHGLAWILLGAIVLLLVYFVVRGLFEREAPEEVATKPVRAAALDGEIEPDVAPGDVESDVYVRKAKEFAANGRFREAVAQLLLGAMSFTEQNGLLRFRRGLTFRSYATALSRAKTSQKAFRAMVALYEPLEYGRREAMREHFDAAQSAYDDGFRAPLPTRRTRPGAR